MRKAIQKPFRRAAYAVPSAMNAPTLMHMSAKLAGRHAVCVQLTEDVKVSGDSRLRVEDDSLALLGDLDDRSLDGRLVTEQRSKGRLDETPSEGENDERDHERGEAVAGANQAGHHGATEQDVGEESGGQL
jgi:hypothetical protein